MLHTVCLVLRDLANQMMMQVQVEARCAWQISHHKKLCIFDTLSRNMPLCYIYLPIYILGTYDPNDHLFWCMELVGTVPFIRDKPFRHNSHVRRSDSDA